MTLSVPYRLDLSGMLDVIMRHLEDHGQLLRCPPMDELHACTMRSAMETLGVEAMDGVLLEELLVSYGVSIGCQNLIDLELTTLLCALLDSADFADRAQVGLDPDCRWALRITPPITPHVPKVTYDRLSDIWPRDRGITGSDHS